MFVGMDFGTTNSAVGVVKADGAAEILSFASVSGSSQTCRSMLAFEQTHRDSHRRLIPHIGQQAIDAYLHGDGECRLLQSFKSYLTSRSFTSASILNTTYSLEDLIALVVERLRQTAEANGGTPVTKVVAGRPVRFVAEDGQIEDDFATSRLLAAFAKAGIPEVVFEYEPIAAAYYYERSLDHDETVLVADFGGGTSDFCLVRLGPGRSRLNRPEDAILGTSGVGIAGDAFDRRIVQYGIADFFGKHDSYRADHKILPMPAWVYGKFERWHHIGFLNAPQTLRMLRGLHRYVGHPEQLDNLLTLIEHNLGYHLYRAVEQTKLDLSHGHETVFRFDHDPIDISRTITRSEFEGWIGEELTDISNCVEGLLETTGISADKVDRVFMTGGSSLVPAVRAIFERRFGPERISAGGEFISVASGLAYRAREVFSRE
jgi:hypothetical chaperone protein